MSVPNFTAEASLYRSNQIYHSPASSNHCTATMQPAFINLGGYPFRFFSSAWFCSFLCDVWDQDCFKCCICMRMGSTREECTSKFYCP